MDSDALNKWIAVGTAKGMPMQASLELTNRCNERCRHCYIPSYRDDRSRILSLQNWITVIDKLRDAGTFFVILIGGEPMLSRHFWGVLEACVDRGMYTTVITNGLLIDATAARRLKTSGIGTVTFSLYSMNTTIHDGLTQVPGSLEKTISAIEHCLAAGVKVSLNFLATKENIFDYFDVIDWAIERDIQVQADPLITPKLDGNLDPTKLRATEEQLRRFYRELAAKFPMGTPQPNQQQQNDYVCNAAKGKCAVTAYGELLPCIEIREPLGSLVDQSFEDIWYSRRAKPWRNMQVADIDRSKDELYNFCDHCPGMADHEHNDATKPVEFARTVAKVKNEIFKERVDVEHK